VIKVHSALARKLVTSVLLVSVLTACSRAEQTEGPPGGEMPALPVKVLNIQSSSVDESSEFVGTLEAAQKVTLQPQIQGRVQQVFVDSGARVNSGAPIVSLSVDQTQANVATAQAGVTSAQAGVTSAQAALATAQARLESAEADRVKAAADLQLQQSEFTRTQTLVQEGAQSQQQLDIAQRNLETAQATLASADKQINAARASVAQTQSAVRSAQASVKEAQSQVTAASVDLGFKQVTSPIAGVVGDLPVKVGDYVTPQTTITTITSNNQFDMRIAVPSNYASRLQTGLPVQLLDPNTKQAIGSGSIYFISPQIDAFPTTAVCEMDNTCRLKSPGIAATVF
jgi:multidrug efflux pump subunit AcrA (membrane-fusion protein)